jgi:hypothetical protein
MDKKKHLKLVTFQKDETKSNEPNKQRNQKIEKTLDETHFIAWEGIHHFIDLAADFIYEDIPAKGIFSNSDDGTILAIMLSKELSIPYIKNVDPNNKELLVAVEVYPKHIKELQREHTLRISIFFDPNDNFTPDFCALPKIGEYILPWY